MRLLLAVPVLLGLSGLAAGEPESVPSPANFASPAPAGPEGNPGPADLDPSLAALIRAVEEAWRGGSADPLAPYLGRRGVGLSLAGEDLADGWFSRNQALSLLDRLLRSSPTVRFEFVRFRNLDGSAGRPNAAAVWEHRRAPDQPSRQVVFLSLARDGEGWVVAELKTKEQRAAPAGTPKPADR